MPYYLCRIAGEDGRVEVRSMLAPSAEVCRKAFEATGVLVLSARRDWNRLEAQGLPAREKGQGPGHHPFQLHHIFQQLG